jgi:hypothetical protein
MVCFSLLHSRTAKSEIDSGPKKTFSICSFSDGTAVLRVAWSASTKDSGKPSITWPELVDQALCFGWIDGMSANGRRVAVVTLKPKAD